MFQDIVKDRLKRFSSHEVSEEQKGDYTLYTTQITDKTGSIQRKLEVEARRGDVMHMKLCIAVGVREKCSMTQLYSWINKKQDKYYYGRVYVDSQGNLITDYQCHIRVDTDSKTSERKGAKDVYEIIQLVGSVMMIYTEDFEEFMKKNVGNGNTLAIDHVSKEDLCLDPFQARELDKNL